MRRKRNRHVMAAPVALVGRLGKKDRRRRGARPHTAAGLLGQAARVPGQIGRAAPGQASKALSKHLPSRRRRRKLVKKLKGDMSRLSGLVEGVSTVVSVAAAGGELLSALRGRNDGSTGREASPRPEEEDDWEEQPEQEDGSAGSEQPEEEDAEGVEGAGDAKGEGSDEGPADEEDAEEEGMRRAS